MNVEIIAATVAVSALASGVIDVVKSLFLPLTHPKTEKLFITFKTATGETKELELQTDDAESIVKGLSGLKDDASIEKVDAR